MAKITSKLRGMVPIEAAGDVVQIAPPTAGASTTVLNVNERLELFEAATIRQRKRESLAELRKRTHRRGWTREDLYQRGLPH